MSIQREDRSPQRGWKIEHFDKILHDRSRFDCGNAQLNEWLRERISQFERRDLARTYVLCEEGDTVVLGYYALSNNSVERNNLQKDQAKGLPNIAVPVVLLGRLAVDRSLQGQGLGSLLLLDALSRIESQAGQIGIRAVEVDAIDDSARKFYLKYGFSPLLDDRNHLFLPMQIIRKLKFPKS